MNIKDKIYFENYIFENINVREKLLEFLKEDIPLGVDYSSFFLDKNIKAVILLKEPSFLCGLPFIKVLFEEILNVKVKSLYKEGSYIEKVPANVIILEGKASKILKGERLALNILQRLSGIANLTRKFVEKIRKVSKKTYLLDTRKTTPGFRLLEKYASLVGGAKNHRLSLSDGVMIKDNHIKIFGSVSKAIKEIKKHIPITLKLEVEVENKAQIDEIIENNLQDEVDILMLDNFSVEKLKEIIPYVKKHFPKTYIEVSGGVNLDTIEEIAKLEPDFISTSKTILQAKAVDYSLEILD